MASYSLAPVTVSLLGVKDQYPHWVCIRRARPGLGPRVYVGAHLRVVANDPVGRPRARGRRRAGGSPGGPALRDVLSLGRARSPSASRSSPRSLSFRQIVRLAIPRSFAA